MKALTLTQPWASAVAVGLKSVETRSWRTPYRGPIVIHAAKGVTKADRHFYRQLMRDGYRLPPGLPLGAVVATANLVRIERTEDIAPFLSRTERLFGDYTPGRWAWVLEDVVALDAPMFARGALGLWEFDDVLLVPAEMRLEQEASNG